MASKYTYMREGDTVFFTSHPEYHQNAQKLTQAEGKRQYREQNIRNLLGILKPGQTVYTSVKTVSRSGMSRVIRLYVADGNIIRNISGYVANALDWPGYQDGVKVGGFGMDMGFHTVYTLGRVLWPKGTPEPHGTRNGVPDSDGGYALKQEWI